MLSDCTTLMTALKKYLAKESVNNCLLQGYKDYKNQLTYHCPLASRHSWQNNSDAFYLL